MFAVINYIKSSVFLIWERTSHQFCELWLSSKLLGLIQWAEIRTLVTLYEYDLVFLSNITLKMWGYKWLNTINKTRTRFTQLINDCKACEHEMTWLVSCEGKFLWLNSEQWLLWPMTMTDLNLQVKINFRSNMM